MINHYPRKQQRTFAIPSLVGYETVQDVTIKELYKEIDQKKIESIVLSSDLSSVIAVEGDTPVSSTHISPLIVQNLVDKCLTNNIAKQIACGDKITRSDVASGCDCV